jgi:hypothetical protein
MNRRITILHVTSLSLAYLLFLVLAEKLLANASDYLRGTALIAMWAFGWVAFITGFILMAQQARQKGQWELWLAITTPAGLLIAIMASFAILMWIMFLNGLVRT